MISEFPNVIALDDYRPGFQLLRLKKSFARQNPELYRYLEKTLDSQMLSQADKQAIFIQIMETVNPWQKKIRVQRNIVDRVCCISEYKPPQSLLNFVSREREFWQNLQKQEKLYWYFADNFDYNYYYHPSQIYGLIGNNDKKILLFLVYACFAMLRRQRDLDRMVLSIDYLKETAVVRLLNAVQKIKILIFRL